MTEIARFAATALSIPAVLTCVILGAFSLTDIPMSEAPFDFVLLVAVIGLFAGIIIAMQDRLERRPMSPAPIPADIAARAKEYHNSTQWGR